MSHSYSEAVSIARDYYNSDDADNFYAIIWGGEDIHIGLQDLTKWSSLRYHELEPVIP